MKRLLLLVPAVCAANDTLLDGIDIAGHLGSPLTAGCSMIFLDLGANLGVQTRKLFEAEKYTKGKRPPVFRLFANAFGLDRDVWRTACSVGFDQRLQRRSDSPFRVVAIDFGIKRAILDRLVAHGCKVTVVPADSDLKAVLDHQPDGVFLSNGPGDPSAVTSGIQLATDLLGTTDLPLFGICLGHQILGLALGGRTYKLNSMATRPQSSLGMLPVKEL
mgnify:CR=1 FL=1